MSASSAYRPLVLCYHAVSATWEHQLAVRPEAFDAHLRWALRRGYRPAPAEALLGGRDKALHVTFDDGFASVTRVLELMTRLSVRASVFACTGYAVDGRPFDAGKLAGEAEQHPDELRTMRFDELRALAAAGVEIGSHTVSHPRLTQLGDHELRQELAESKQQLEDELRRPCRYIAYPFGDEDGRVRRAARTAGYLGGFSLPGRWNETDPHGIPRVGLYRKDGLAHAALKFSSLGRRAAVWKARRVHDAHVRPGASDA